MCLLQECRKDDKNSVAMVDDGHQSSGHAVFFRRHRRAKAGMNRDERLDVMAVKRRLELAAEDHQFLKSGCRGIRVLRQSKVVHEYGNDPVKKPGNGQRVVSPFATPVSISGRQVKVLKLKFI